MDSEEWTRVQLAAIIGGAIFAALVIVAVLLWVAL